MEGHLLFDLGDRQELPPQAQEISEKFEIEGWHEASLYIRALRSSLTTKNEEFVRNLKGIEKPIEAWQ